MPDATPKYDTTLPEGFTGTFYFTNYSTEDFTAKWNSKSYTFPKETTSPIYMPDHTALEIQQIRKKFAKDLAEREFYKSQEYNTLRGQEGTMGNRNLNSIHQAGQYSLDTLAPYIQRALEPLPISQAIVTNAPRVRLEEKLSKNDDGELNTGAVKSDKDLESLAKGTMEQRVLG